MRSPAGFGRWNNGRNRQPARRRIAAAVYFSRRRLGWLATRRASKKAPATQVEDRATAVAAIAGAEKEKGAAVATLAHARRAATPQAVTVPATPAAIAARPATGPRIAGPSPRRMARPIWPKTRSKVYCWGWPARPYPCRQQQRSRRPQMPSRVSLLRLQPRDSPLRLRHRFHRALHSRRYTRIRPPATSC